MSKSSMFQTRNTPKPLKCADHTPKVSWISQTHHQNLDTLSTTSQKKNLAYSMETINELTRSKQTRNSSGDRQSKLKQEYHPYNPNKSSIVHSQFLTPADSTSSIDNDTEIPDERQYELKKELSRYQGRKVFGFLEKAPK